MTDLMPYGSSAPGEYRGGLVMTPDDARALDEQVRRCTEAVLREGTDYGIIPGTNGEKTLWRPGAQKLLQWFGLSFTCERVEVERDDDGRKHGITYRATVARRMPDGTLDIKATCEGTADYDESKFYQSAEEVQRKAEYNERKWARQYDRVADPTKWKNRGEYRADWNALMKRAQKRAIVGAVVDATAAGGIFSDREEDDSAPVADDGSTWYEQALESALTFTDQAAGRTLYVQAAQAARDGLCTPRQAGHVQNRIQQRVQRLKTAISIDIEDLGRQAAAHPPSPGPADEPSDEVAKEEAPAQNDTGTPGTVTGPQLTAIWTVLTDVYKFGKDEKSWARGVCAHIIGRELASTKDMSRNEAATALDVLANWQKAAEGNQMQPREFLIELMAAEDKTGDGGAA